MREDAQLYGADSLHLLEWPKSADGEFSKRYFEPLIQNGVKHYFKNINTELFMIKCGDVVMPVAVIDDKASNSYVCSPYGHYILYALENLHQISNPFFRKVVKGVLSNYGSWLRSGGIDSIVYVNNWLMSIDLYPEGIDSGKTEAITELLKSRFPNSAIVFRSIGAVITPQLHEDLDKLGYQMIASRHNYYADTKDEAIFQRRILKSDMKLLRETDYEIITGEDASEVELKRALELYHEVYIDGHSKLNPDVTPAFMELMFKDGLLNMRLLRKNGVIEGAVGFYDRNGVFFCPFLGYDKHSADHSVLYRLLSTILLSEAKKKGLLFQAGAGATFFKKIRFQKTFKESMAVYYGHLPLKRRLPWASLKQYVNRVVYPMMKKY